MEKMLKFAAAAVIVLGIAMAITCQFAHKLENQNLAIVQSMAGDVEVRRDAGWWLQVSPTITQYPKAGIYQLNARDRDPLEIQFKNKSTAVLNVNIGYRIDSCTDDVIIALHQQVEGNDEKIWKMLCTALNTMAQAITTKYDPSDVIGGDKFEMMVQEMHAAILHNETLMKHGIDVNYFAVDGRPIPDKDTAEQFAKQREADLARRLAEAEKVKLEAEKLKVEANYAMKISEQKGQAEAEMAKAVQSAEKEKKLAEIAAAQRVEVAKLEKEQAEIAVEKVKSVAKIEAEKLREVAEIEKQTEAARLEKEKLIAEQVKVAALAKKEQIEKSGAITEKEKIQLEVEMKTKIGVADAYGKALANARLPQMMVINSGSADGKQTASSNPFDILLQTMTLEKLNKLAPAQNAK